MTTIAEQAEKYKNKPGSMLVTAGMLTRMYARQEFTKAGFELTPEQVSVLEVIMENDGLYQRQLSEITLKDRPNISRIINILEETGYARRVEDVNQRKIFKIFVTEKARVLFPPLTAKIKELRKHITNKIEPEDLEVCLKVLGQVYENLIGEVNMQI